MGLDIRWPIGLMFSLIGALLTGYGALYEISIDLRWGLVLLVFGLLMLFLAWRGKTKASPTDSANKP
ncbi:MAG: hypothetical protein ABSC18_08195 [Verrucomicrobiota bacterium]|jgi:hypothetical protein